MLDDITVSTVTSFSATTNARNQISQSPNSETLVLHTNPPALALPPDAKYCKTASSTQKTKDQHFRRQPALRPCSRAALTDHPTDATLVAKDSTTGDARLNERRKADYCSLALYVWRWQKHRQQRKTPLENGNGGGARVFQPCIVNCSATNRFAQRGRTKFKNLTVWQPLGLS